MTMIINTYMSSMAAMIYVPGRCGDDRREPRYGDKYMDVFLVCALAAPAAGISVSCSLRREGSRLTGELFLNGSHRSRGTPGLGQHLRPPPVRERK